MTPRETDATARPPPGPHRRQAGPGHVEDGSKHVQLDLPILLPEIHGLEDPCVARLVERVEAKQGVVSAHITASPGADPGLEGPVPASLCIHYDPNTLALREIERIVTAEGGSLTDRYKHETLWIRGMDCADCSSSIEHVLARQEGLLEVNVNYAAEKARIEYDAQTLDRQRILDVISSMGYQVEQGAPGHGPGEHARGHGHGGLGGLALPLVSGVALAIGFLGPLLVGMPATWSLPFYIVAYLAGGWEAFGHTLGAVRARELDIEALMVVAALGAAALGHWAEGGLLLFLFSLGHGLEHLAMDKARDAIGQLGELMPRTATVRRGGEEIQRPVEELERGDRVVVAPGERIPVDGEIREGTSSVDQAAITGESVPVEKAPGDEVLAGTVNGPGSLVVEVTKLAKDTTIQRVLEMVEEAQTQKAPSQRASERWERRFAPAILGFTVLVILVPPALQATGPWDGSLAWLGWLALPWQESLLRGLALLVAASPCALAISTPAAILSGLGKGARGGILLKGGVHLEALATVRAIAFDKTGTITYGTPEVTDVVPIDGVEARELLRVAASIEAKSQHPLAKAVVAHARDQGLDLAATGPLESTAGLGVTGELDGQPVTIGTPRFLARQGATVPGALSAQVQDLEAQGKTTMVVDRGGRVLGAIALSDRAREEGRAMVQRLRELGVEHLVLLTGDNEPVARAIAEEVGFTAYKAGLLPEDKVQAVRELLDQHGSVAMVGDGVNDAPAMAQATVGVAMGASGTDVALETADVALLGDRLENLPIAYELSTRTRSVIRQNLLISLAVIVALVPLAALGLAGIAPAIIAHEGSTLLVVANALRLLA